MTRALVISAHPDDETLGAGGTLLGHKARGDEIFWAVVTQPAEGTHSSEIIQRATSQVAEASRAFGFAKHVRLGFPTAMLDTVPQAKLMESLRGMIAETKPGIVYLVHGGDVHTDHQAVFNATMAVLKPFHMRSLGVKRVLCFETLSSTDAAVPDNARAFLPNVFVDISLYIDRKIRIMEIFQTEKQDDLMPRGSSAIRSLARVRGATVGVEFAEAFMLVRELL